MLVKNSRKMEKFEILVKKSKYRPKFLIKIEIWVKKIFCENEILVTNRNLASRQI